MSPVVCRVGPRQRRPQRRLGRRHGLGNIPSVRAEAEGEIQLQSDGGDLYQRC